MKAKPSGGWERLFRDYLEAVYNQDHIVAQRAIGNLRTDEERAEVQALYADLDRVKEEGEDLEASE